MASYTIKGGDCFCSIAKQKGFNDFTTIYKAGSNRTDWPNPNTLEPGKTIELPEKTKKTVNAAVDKLHKFVLTRTPTRLRLAFADVELKALNIKAQTLTMSSPAVLKSSAGGKVEYQIDPVVGTASIVVELTPPPAHAPAPPPAAGPAPDPNAYPPPVNAAHFEDKMPDAPPTVEKVNWRLSLGTLRPKAVKAGTLQRLVNLGGVMDAGRSAEAESLLIKLWQRRKKQTETGAATDVAEDVATAHDRP